MVTETLLIKHCIANCINPALQMSCHVDLADSSRKIMMVYKHQKQTISSNSEYK